MPQSLKQPDGEEQAAMIAGLLKGIVSGFCLTLEVFLHGRFGRRYITGGGAGLLVLYVFTAFFPRENQLPMFAFMTAYTAAWLAAMVSSWVRSWRSRDREHGGYTGRPRLLGWMPSFSEEAVKHLEALAVFGAGFWTARLNAPLGDYLMAASVLVLIRGLLMSAKLRRQAIEMNDMVIEQRIVAERFREMQGS